MPTVDEINDAIAENAAGPKRVQVGNQSVDQHSADDQIKLAQHVAEQTAKSKNHFGLPMRVMRPGGCG